jgi:hypothetical protein
VRQAQKALENEIAASVVAEMPAVPEVPMPPAF